MSAAEVLIISVILIVVMGTTYVSVKLYPFRSWVFENIIDWFEKNKLRIAATIVILFAVVSFILFMYILYSYLFDNKKL